MRQEKTTAVAAFAKRHMLTGEEEREILDLWFSEDEVPQYRIAQMLEKECFAGKIKWQTWTLASGELHKTFECDEVIRALVPLLELEFFDDEEAPMEEDGRYHCDVDMEMSLGDDAGELWVGNHEIIGRFEEGDEK